VAEAGLEPPADYPGKAKLSTESDAKSDALSADLQILTDPELRGVVAAWPNLQDKVKVKILRLATQGRHGKSCDRT
jgi:hypothetical protein